MKEPEKEIRILTDEPNLKFCEDGDQVATYVLVKVQAVKKTIELLDI